MWAASDGSILVVDVTGASWRLPPVTIQLHRGNQLPYTERVSGVRTDLFSFLREAMTESEIAEVEQATGCQLPQAYRCVLLHYPAFLLRQAAEDRVDEAYDLYRTKSSLVDANTSEQRSLFPPHCFVIGENGCGDQYAILTTAPDAPVFIGGPHEGEYPMDDLGNAIPAYESIYAFVASLHRSSRQDEVPAESVLDRLTGALGTLLILPIVVIGSVVAASTAPFVVMVLWAKRWLGTSTRTTKD